MVKTTGSSDLKLGHFLIIWILEASLGRTGGAVCKVSYSLARATGRSWVQAPAAILARLGN
jgi:hypothetical protein